MRILDNSLLTRLEFQFLPIITQLEGKGGIDISKRPGNDKWSIAENIAHLGRYQEIFIKRVDQILAHENPEFDRYKANEDVDFGPWLDKSMQALRSDIEKDRKVIFTKITSLANDELVRRGRHPKLGWLDIVDWVEFFLLHEAHHLYTIFWLEHEHKRED